MTNEIKKFKFPRCVSHCRTRQAARAIGHRHIAPSNAESCQYLPGDSFCLGFTMYIEER